jgi:hypothetical protein
MRKLLSFHATSKPLVTWAARLRDPCPRPVPGCRCFLMCDAPGFQLIAAGLRPSNSCSWPS